MHATQLASGKITNADTVTIGVGEPPDLSPRIRVRGTENPRSSRGGGVGNVAARHHANPGRHS